MPAPVLNYQSHHPSPKPGARLGTMATAFFVIAGGIIPLLGMALAAFGSVVLVQHDSPASMVAGMLFSPLCAWPVYPLVLMSSVSICSVAVGWNRPIAIWERRWILIGLVTNLLYALAVLVWFFEALESSRNSFSSLPFALAIWLIELAIALSFVTQFRVSPMRATQSLEMVFVAWLVVFLLLAFGLMVMGDPLVALFSGVLLAITPTSSLLAFAVMTGLLRSEAVRPGSGAANKNAIYTAGISSIAFATSLLSAIATYPPVGHRALCYVATAALNGHARVVRSRQFAWHDGTSVVMSDQLRTLICAELTLLAICPSLRRWFRRIYDLVGPRLAKRVRTPAQADLAYLSMKPLEWAGWLLLVAVFGHPSRVTRCLGQGRA